MTVHNTLEFFAQSVVKKRTENEKRNVEKLRKQQSKITAALRFD